MRLFIAEKPSVARAIVGVLAPGATRQSDHYDCGGVLITWCFGHMLEPVEPAEYKPEWERWTEDSLPIIPDGWKLKPRKDALDQLNGIGRLLKEADEVVHAGDPDREGQLLVDEVLDHFNYKGAVSRLWLNAADERSVKKALDDIRDNVDYADLSAEARTRQKADFWVGMSLTRAYTLRGRKAGWQGVSSVGRVQTPTWCLVVERDLEIENFVPVDYFLPVLDLAHANGPFRATWRPTPDREYPGLNGESQIATRVLADSILKAAEDEGKGKIISLDRKNEKKAAPMPYTLSALQKDAGKRFGYGAAQTLELAQSLYDDGYLTYPRTDCAYLKDEFLPDASEILAGLSKLGVDGAGAADPSRRHKAWNTEKVGKNAHHGIIPTMKMPSRLQGERRAVYDMVASSYVAIFLPDYEYESTSLTVLSGGELWESRGQTVIEAGWRAHGSGGSDNPLPTMAKGDLVDVEGGEVQSKQTKPPPRFTESLLIDAMCNIHRFEPNPVKKARLKESKGLGTEATRASMIETIKSRAYVEAKKAPGGGKRKEMNLISTPRARALYKALPKAMREGGTTALWEDGLAAIGDGKLSPEKFLASQREAVIKMTAMALKADLPTIGTVHKCPACESPMRQMKGGGKLFWGCTAYPECKETLPDNKGKPGKRMEIQESDKPCPSCAKPLRRINGSKGWFWACSDRDDCNIVLPDNNGEPGQREPYSDEPCPKCGEQKLRRRESKKKPGAFFHVCGACDTFFGDDNGKAGEPFEQKAKDGRKKKRA